MAGATSFPGPLSFSSLVVEERDPGSLSLTTTISYPESSGSLVSGLVARRDSGEMEFFPQKSGVPVVVRMLSFIKTEVNESREVGMLDESLGYLQ